jgi:hypothetical protein
MDEEHRDGTLDLLSRHRLAYVCVDEPQGFPDTLPPVAEELAEWVPKIRTLHAGSRPVHVLMNNCWQGFAVRSAHTLAGLLAEDSG